jgi:superfamily II DNA helicase RecQ
MEAVTHIDILPPYEFNQLMLHLQKVIQEQEYPGDCPTILLLSSASVSRLKPLIEQLLVKKRISFVFIDDADLLPEDGLSYCLDLLKVKENLLQHLPPDMKVLAVTATMTDPICQSLEQVTGLKFDTIMWGPMHRQRIYIWFEPVTRNNRKK